MKKTILITCVAALLAAPAMARGCAPAAPVVVGAPTSPHRYPATRRSAQRIGQGHVFLAERFEPDDTEALRDRLAHEGKPPALVLVVDVVSAMLHCPKCMIRSHMWEPDGWPDVAQAPTSAERMAVRAGAGTTVEAMQDVLTETNRDQLY